MRAVALRGRRQGAAAPPAPPAQGFAPGNPDSMHVSAERLARMLMGEVELAAYDPSFGTTEACAEDLILICAFFAGGLGARCAPNGEREGRSPLAEHAQDVLRPQWGARGAKPARSPG